MCSTAELTALWYVAGISALGMDGGDKGARTPDLLIANETLYQLSYIPIV